LSSHPLPPVGQQLVSESIEVKKTGNVEKAKKMLFKDYKPMGVVEKVSS
jgi:hypothetical protein